MHSNTSVSPTMVIELCFVWDGMVEEAGFERLELLCKIMKVMVGEVGHGQRGGY